MKTIGQKFKTGETVWLDKDTSNSSEVNVISQTPLRLFTSVTDGANNWDVMTSRLTKK